MNKILNKTSKQASKTIQSKAIQKRTVWFIEPIPNVLRTIYCIDTIIWVVLCTLRNSLHVLVHTLTYERII